MEKDQVEALKADVIQKFKAAEGTFQDAPEESRDFLKQFSFICALSFDVYLKKLLIEKLVDQLAEPEGAEKKEKDKEKEKAKDKEKDKDKEKEKDKDKDKEKEKDKADASGS